jgi:DNA repair exonuclease SbcCD ATPase subunit
MTLAKTPLRLALLALGATLSLACAAQDDNRGSREKEALRRTQAALRQAQEQQAALAREKDSLAGERDKLDASAKKAQSQLAASRSDAARLNASLAHANDELAATRTRDEAARQDLEQRLAEQSQQLAAARRVADERARANASLTALLEQATKSLASAERANEQMHALGLQMIDRLRGRGGASDAVDPVLGFGQVRLENEAEALRDKLDAAKLPAAHRTPGAAP